MVLRKKHIAVAFLLGSTALTLPSVAVAETPAPSFISPDQNSVDVASGLPWLSVVEGGIGSGPGRIEMQRIWAEGAGFQDNWTGGLYDVTTNGVTKKYLQFGGISDTFSGSGTTWTSDKAEGATLTYDSVNAQWIYTARDGTVIRFDNTSGDRTHNCPGVGGLACKPPVSITHPSGLKITLNWETADICVDLPGEPCGREYLYNRLSTITSSAGYSAAFGYQSDAAYAQMPATDPWYQRTSVTFGNSASPPSPSPTITYAYPSSTETDVTDPAGRKWIFATDSSGNLTGITRPGSSSANISYAYGADGSVASATNDGVTTTYSRSVSGSAATETITDALSNVSSAVSDTTIGRPTSYQDANGNTTAYAYDANARLTKVTHPEGNYEQYAYDARGNAITVTKVAKSKSGLSNIVTSANYDATCSNVVKCNEPNSTTDARGNVTNYSYDPTHGGVLTVTPPSPATGVQPQTRYSYTQVTGASGDLVYMLTGVAACPSGSTSCTTANEVRAAAAYNSSLLATSITRGNSSGTVAATTTATYDSHGNVATVDGPLSGTADTTNYRYDAAGEVVGVTSPSPANGQPDRAIRITYRPDGQVSKQELGTVADQSDTAWSAFSPLQTIDIGFDANSRAVTKKLSGGSTVYALTQTDYDADGRLTCTAVRMAPAGSLPASACTQMTGNADQITQLLYDAAGEVTDRVVGVGVSGQSATERQLAYNPNGTVASLKDANANVTTYAYDGFDRLATTAYPDGSTDKATGYDNNGNLTSLTNRAAQIISFTYDTLNRITAKNPPGSANDVTYAWDNLGRLTSASQTGTALSFTYDALSNNLTQVGSQGTVASGYDLAGRRTSIAYPGSPALTVTYNYLTTGEVSSILDGATSLATYTYDALGNRTKVSFGNGTSENYTLDPVSRLTTLTFAGLPSADNLTIGGSTTPIAYNAASQITSAKRTDGASSNTYSFTGYSAVTRTNTVNTLNQVVQTTSSIAPTTSFAYDTKGNLAQSGSTFFCYDAENHLTATDTTSGCASPTASLAYDPLGRLQTVTAGTTTTNFAYDGLNMLAEYSGSTLTNRYVFGQNMDEPIVAYDASGNRSWLYSDERGSIMASANSTAGMLYTNTYDEYGAPPVNSSGTSLNSGRFQYTGQMWVPEVGLYYYKARLYSPTMGRFMQTDPIGYADNSNLYTYVHNDPIDDVDPVGLDEIVVTGSRCPEGMTCYSGIDDSGIPMAFAPTMNSQLGGGGGAPITVTGKRQNKPTGETPWYWTGVRWAPDPLYDPRCANEAVNSMVVDALGFIPAESAGAAGTKFAAAAFSSFKAAWQGDGLGISLGYGGMLTELFGPAGANAGKAVPFVALTFAGASLYRDALALSTNCSK